MGRGSNKLVALLVSHDGRARAGLAGLMIIIPVMAVLLVQSSIAKGRLPLAFFIGLSTEDPYSPNTSPAALYAGSGEQRFSVLHLPHVSSRVVQGPYLELFMPFIPRLHGPALQASRPGALTVTREPEASAGRLECLAQLADIRIDGAALGLRLDATSDPETGQPVMLAMLPVSALAPGRHELSLNAPTRGDGNAQAPRRYRIPFWK